MSAVVLALHTSDAVGSVAVAQDGRVTAHEFPSAGKTAPVVLREILRALETAGVALEECTGVAVTTGPGSFTGIRIGISTAQGLAAARRWPVYALDSLTAAAAACPRGDAPLAVVLDARRGEVYAALYDVHAPAPRLTLEAFCSPVADAARRLAGAATSLEVTGSGAALVLADQSLAGAAALAACEPVAQALARLAADGACRSTTARGLEPDYLRKSDAELQRHPAPR
jgi:tRNA threonylcarbamoyladenosine biosynthesis protein TsaB